jgi:hypothetical protein
MARSPWRLRGAVTFLVVALLCVAAVSELTSRSSALGSTSAAAPTVGDTFEPVLGIPASNVRMLGDSTASGETWALGELGTVPATVNGRTYAEQQVMLRHTVGSGWQVVPLPLGPSGHPVTVGTGASSADGGVVLITDAGIVARDPGGQPRLLSDPEAALLGTEESLPPQSPSTPPYTTVEDHGHAGVLIAPGGDGQQLAAGILHYDGETWTREPIEGASVEKPQFTPQALACGAAAGADTIASSPTNCWLLASYRLGSTSGAPGRLALFRRDPAQTSGYEWVESTVEGEEAMLLGELKPGSGEAPSVSPLESGAQMLTATAQGVWVDLQAKAGEGPAVDVSKLVVPTAAATATSRGTWCFGGTSAFCTQAHTYPALLPAAYRSFAWSGSGEGWGTRIVTGLTDRAMLELEGGSFVEVVGAGGRDGSAPGAAAFSEPDQGWIADEVSPGQGFDGQGQSPVIHVTTDPEGDQLAEESVPFRRPLYAVAQAPGSVAGDHGAQAIAVGAVGEIARYTPGLGWRAEALLNSAGKVQTPTLRAVAWPIPGRAYAVGDEGTMWMWQAATGLWVPDPGKPLNFLGQLSAIAFSASNPNIGYAVGRQGVLLRFGKSWEQEDLPAELQRVNFTSVAFAGNEAFATYRTLAGQTEIGGLAVREGTGPWHVDAGAAALLGKLSPAATVLSRVAGLPDGGVVAAGPGLVIERDSPSAPWRFSPEPLPEAQNVSALAAYREPGGPVRAVISIDLDGFLNPQTWDGQFLEFERSPFKIDVLPLTSASGPPAFLPPDLLPNSGYVLKETATGWLDMEHQALPDTGTFDRPNRPDPVLALIVSASGESGLAVGGQTGDIEGLGVDPGQNGGDFGRQTAATMRFPAADSSSGGAGSAPIESVSGDAGFVVAGQAACVASCASFQSENLGPEAWLAHALDSASSIAAKSPGGLHAFLYTGSVIGTGGEDVFSRYLGNHEGSLPAYGPAAGFGPGVEPGPAPTRAYRFVSEGAGGRVMVVVLDCSKLEEAQLAWIEQTLAKAKQSSMPAIVLGNASLGFRLPEPRGAGPATLAPRTAEAVSSILVHGGASAYLFDYPESDVAATVSSGGKSIPAYGTGTLGYAGPPSGFLLAEVNPTPRSPTVTNVAPYEVTALNWRSTQPTGCSCVAAMSRSSKR